MQVNKEKEFKFCYPFPEEWGPEYPKAMVLAKFLAYYAIPLMIIGIFYIMIAIHLAFGASVPGEMQGAMRQVSPFATCMNICQRRSLFETFDLQLNGIQRMKMK